MIQNVESNLCTDGSKLLKNPKTENVTLMNQMLCYMYMLCIENVYFIHVYSSYTIDLHNVFNLATTKYVMYSDIIQPLIEIKQNK